MAYTVKIRNGSDEEIQIYPSTDYMLANISGLTPADAVINAVEMATQDGSHFNSARVMPRNVVVTFYIRGEGSIVRQRRVNLYRYIRPKHPIRLYLANDQRDVYIDGYVETMQDGGTIFSDREQMQVSIICPDPYFRDNETGDRMVTFSAITPKFIFPFHIETPVPFSTLDEVFTKIIENAGDADCGVTLNVLANGDIKNPWFYNDTTGERMTFEITLEDGDELIISTVHGHKSAKLRRAGTETNVINTLSHGSKWLTLEPGTNAFFYNAESGATEMALTFVYTILYEGI